MVATTSILCFLRQDIYALHRIRNVGECRTYYDRHQSYIIKSTVVQKRQMQNLMLYVLYVIDMVVVTRLPVGHMHQDIGAGFPLEACQDEFSSLSFK